MINLFTIIRAACVGATTDCVKGVARADVERLRAVAQAKDLSLSSYVRGVLLRSLAAHERRR